MARNHRTVSKDAWLGLASCVENPPEIVLFGRTTVHAGWAFESRILPEHLVYYVLQNEAEATIGASRFRLGPGDLCWLAPRVLHTFANADPDHPITLYHLRLIVRRHRQPVRLDQDLLHLAGAWDLRPQFDQLHDDWRTHLPHRSIRLAAGFALLFSTMFRLAPHRQERARVLTAAQRQRLYGLVERDKASRLAPADLAREVGLSPAYFARVFGRTFGRSPRQWLVEQRIRAAQVLLDEPRTQISDVAIRLGYPDVFLFSRQFKQVTGISPRAYRQQENHL